jgi:putative DNA primase/helicase
MPDDWQMPGATTIEITPDDAEIARLAALPALQYDREREAAAAKLGCRVSTLDATVRAVSPRNGGTGSVAGVACQGRPLDLHEPEPSPNPVNGAALLDDLVTAIRNYVVVGDAEAVAVALWVVASHAFDTFSIFPRLFVTAPERGCGKSTLLDVIGGLVRRKLSADSITAAALFRTIEAARPTLLLDEADTYLRDREDLRGVIDSGHRRDGGVIRTVGDNHEPRRFSTSAPVALAAIGRLPGTIEDRSIKIEMRRRRPDEVVSPLRLDRASALEQLASQAARWARDHGQALDAADPVMPAGIYNRLADNWRPLLAVADVTGGTWPDRTRKAAIELSADAEDTASAGVWLLTDLRELFVRAPTGILFTKELLAALHQDETRPWPDWKNGRPITERHLAGLLKPHKIKPKTVRRGTQTEKGYRAEWFNDVFARYLPARSVTPSQLSNSAGLEPPRSVTAMVTATVDVTDRKCQNASISAGCDAVTDPEPGSPDAETIWTA